MSGANLSSAPGNTAPAACTKQLMDQELARILAMYNSYAAGLSGFRGCLDITQDLAFRFIQLSPKIQCWDKGIAWRMSVVYSLISCYTNFMHNAFMVWPLTTAFGHSLQVLDPYTFWGLSHPAKVQGASAFLDGSSCGGFEYGATNATQPGEAKRAQKCIDGNATFADCKDMYTCLKQDYPNLVDNCQ